jgi:hypothetical protein
MSKETSKQPRQFGDSGGAPSLKAHLAKAAAKPAKQARSLGDGGMVYPKLRVHIAKSSSKPTRHTRQFGNGGQAPGLQAHLMKSA